MLRALASYFAILMAILGIGFLSVTVASGDLQTADQRASVISAICVLIAGIASALALRRRSNEQTDPDQLELAARALRNAVVNQWRREAVTRNMLRDPLAVITWRRIGAVVPEPLATGDTYSARAYAAFCASPDERLIVVGPAGYGKSTFAILTLLKIASLRQDEVPVLLNASSWDSRTVPFVLWLERQIAETYPFLRSPTYGPLAIETLIESNRLIVIVDGLDESPARVVSTIVGELLDAANYGLKLIVTFRSAANFDRLQNVLSDVDWRKSVIVLLSIEPSDAVDYLQSTASGSVSIADADRWRQIIDISRNHAVDGSRVLRKPFYLSLCRSQFVLKQRLAELIHLLRNFSSLEIQEQLVNDFVRSRLARPRSRRGRRSATRVSDPRGLWGTRRVQRGLRLLVASLSDDGQPANARQHRIRWWRWEVLLTRSEWMPAVLLISGSLYALTASLPSGLRRGTALGFMVTAIIGISRGRLAGWLSCILVATCTSLSISLVAFLMIPPADAIVDGVEIGVAAGICILFTSRLRRGFPQALLPAAIIGLVLGAGMGILDLVRSGPTAGIIRLLTTGLGVVFVVIIAAFCIRYLRIGEPTAQPERLNAAFLREGSTIVRYLGIGTLLGACVGLGGGVTSGFRYMILNGFDQGVRYGIDVGLTYGVCIGLGIGLIGGLVRALSRPASTRSASDPVSSLRSSAVVSAIYLFLVPITTAGALIAANVAIRSDQAPSTWATVVGGATFGLSIGIVMAVALSPWPTYIYVVLWEAMRRRTPLRMLKLCQQAHEVELLRQDGASYRLRHEELRTAIASWSVVDPRHLA